MVKLTCSWEDHSPTSGDDEASGSISAPHPDPTPPGSPVLTLGFATTVAMWLAAYVCRLPIIMAPSWLLVALLLLCLTGGGLALTLLAGFSLRRALGVGALAGTLNLLILGSLLAGTESPGVQPSALVWLPGSLLLSMLLTFTGALLGRAWGGSLGASRRNWSGDLALVAVAATGLLVVAGGLVTGHQAGLAVPDWPNSFYYNMFLFPLQRMSGDIYFEHAHRLLGSLVGLTTLVLAVHLWRVDRRSLVRRLSIAAVVLVLVQGTLGGLRVTGRFTLSAEEADLAPSLILAVVHGVVGQLFLALLAGLAAVTSSRWRAITPAVESSHAATGRAASAALLLVLLAQLSLGAVVRHFNSPAVVQKLSGVGTAGPYQQYLLLHIIVAALVALVVVANGVSAVIFHRDRPPLPRLGRLLLVFAGVQIALGIAAVVVTGGRAALVVDATVSTAHQAAGAALLALASILVFWTRRAIQPPPSMARNGAADSSASSD